MFQYAELICDYVLKNYDVSNDLISMKLKHTIRVYELMVKLVEKLQLDNHDARLALFIALFHDLGRFYEAQKNNKFNNRYDHAADSVQVLFDEGLIKEFPIDEKDYDLIKKAVFYHNKKELPEDLTDKEQFFCHMIRDVDKIDIFHVMATEDVKTFYFIPTEKVLTNFYNKELIDIRDIKNKSDTTLLYLAFPDQLHFKESVKILKEKGYLDEFINSIDVNNDPLIKDIFDHLVEEMDTRYENSLNNKKVLRKEGTYGRIRQKI